MLLVLSSLSVVNEKRPLVNGFGETMLAVYIISALEDFVKNDFSVAQSR